MMTFFTIFITMEILFLITSYLSKRKSEMIQSLLDLKYVSLYFLDWFNQQKLTDVETILFKAQLENELKQFEYENLIELAKNDILYFDLEANHLYAIKEVHKQFESIVKTTQLKYTLPFVGDKDDQKTRLQSILLLQEILDRLDTIQKTIK